MHIFTLRKSINLFAIIIATNYLPKESNYGKK